MKENWKEYEIGQIKFAVRKREKVVGSSPISFHVVLASLSRSLLVLRPPPTMGRHLVDLTLLTLAANQK